MEDRRSPIARFVHDTFSNRLPEERLSEGLFVWSWWYAVSILAVILAPSYLVFGRQLWDFPRVIPQGLVIGLIYLGLILLIRMFAVQARPPLLIAIAAGAVVAVFGLSLLLDRLGWVPSGRMFLAGGILGVVLAVLPLVSGRTFRTTLTIVTTAGVVLLAALSSAKPHSALPEVPEFESTLHYPVTMTLHTDVVPPMETNGGAITRYGDGFLVVTGVGEFYRLAWGSDEGTITAERMPLSPASFNRQELTDSEGPDPATYFRITDVIIDDRNDPALLYISHHHWDADRNCITMRVSGTSMAGSSAGNFQSSAWDIVFESDPCLRVGAEWRRGPGSNLDESGGRLGLHPEGMLLTLGDHASDGLMRTEGQTRQFAQEAGVSYGKIWLLDMKGGGRVYSSGHRNPQGLVVDRAGRIWSTEHGPQGGDELNLIVDGGNYGWPLVTYGVDYSHPYWPLAVNARDHGEYREPSFVFVPSIGISQVIELGDEHFPSWSGDLLIASLRAQTLFRVRSNADGPVYAEPILVGTRIRDLEQGADGRIVLWTDDGHIVTLTRVVLAESTPVQVGAFLFENLCSRCHYPADGATSALGPSLRGVVGRRIAAETAYHYSDALMEVGGTWTEENLDRFLENPSSFAPGTTMNAGVPLEEQRHALIEFLSSQH